MYWDIARHPGDVTETGLDCDFSVMDMALPSDAKYLALAFHMKAF